MGGVWGVGASWCGRRITLRVSENNEGETKEEKEKTFILFFFFFRFSTERGSFGTESEIISNETSKELICDDFNTLMFHFAWKILG